MKIKWKIILLPVIAIVGTAALVSIIAYVNATIENDIVLPKFEKEIINSEKEKLKSLVQAEANAASLLVENMTGKTEEDIKNALIQQTDKVTFFDDNTGYFFIYDMDGNRINVPGVKGEAKTSGNYLTLKDVNGLEMVKALRDAAKKGGDFVEYWFPKKGASEPSPKLSYALPITGTNYFVGAGVYFDEVYQYASNMKALIIDEGDHYRVYIYLAVIIYLVILAIVAFMIIKGILGGLHGIKDILLQIVKTGDTSINIDKKLLVRKDEVGELAHAGKQIIEDFNKVAVVSKNLSERDWRQEVNIKSDNDMMNKSLQSMITEVNSALNEITSYITDLDTGAKQVSAASNALSDGATSQAASIEEISASLTDMSNRTSQNAQNATEASTLAQSANNAAMEGQQKMHNLSDGINSITSRAEETKKVVKTIDDIAFQTNLLALNAAVEAARAGAHGKGFAVVAEEVRNLAARSAKAAGETAELIDNVVVEVKNGNKMTEATAEALNKIVEQINKVTALVADIAKASNSQAHGMTQVNQGLEQIDSVTQQNTANAEETAAASTHMSDLASQLNAVIKKFKLKEKNINNVTKPLKKRPRKKLSTSFSAPSISKKAEIITPAEQIILDDSEFGKF